MSRLTSAASAAVIAGALAYGCGDDEEAAPAADAGASASSSSGAGTSSSSSSSGAAGSSSSSSSSGSSSGASSSASSSGASCTPLATSPYVLATADGEQVLAVATFGAEAADEVHVEVFDATPGTYDLATGADASYATCRHCVIAVVEPQRQTARTFFQRAGQLEVGVETRLDGALEATLSGVELVEVTIDPDTFESTPVPGGGCFRIDAAAIAVAEPPVPAGWLCPTSYWGDHDCDCACGALDYECEAGATPASCDFCLACGSGPQCASRVDPADLAACLPEFTPPPEWTCHPSLYRNGTCDCACGAPDPDCPDGGACPPP